MINNNFNENIIENIDEIEFNIYLRTYLSKKDYQNFIENKKEFIGLENCCFKINNKILVLINHSVTPNNNYRINKMKTITIGWDLRSLICYHGSPIRLSDNILEQCKKLNIEKW